MIPTTSRDGKRFLAKELDRGTQVTRIHVLVNWAAELKR